jgi:hypothetical protein
VEHRTSELVIAKLHLQARDRNNTPTKLITKIVTTQKLNQGKENRPLKPPIKNIAAQHQKEWKPLSSKKYSILQYKIQREMKKMDTQFLTLTKQ